MAFYDTSADGKNSGGGRSYEDWKPSPYGLGSSGDEASLARRSLTHVVPRVGIARPNEERRPG